MADNRQWIPIDDAINSYLNESEQSNSKYFKCWDLAFRAMTELGLDSFYAIKTIKIPVNPNFTADIPADYLQYSKVGVLNENGQIIPLSINSNITNAFDLSPTRVQQTEDNTLPDLMNEQGLGWYNFWDGNFFIKLYGLPSGAPFVGSFNIDNANGVIILSPDFSYPYVILEYICSPEKNQQYYIPIQFKEAVIAYLRWKDTISLPISRHGSLGDKQMRRRDFFNERRLAIARYKPTNLAENYEWNLKNQRIAVKG